MAKLKLPAAEFNAKLWVVCAEPPIVTLELPPNNTSPAVDSNALWEPVNATNEGL